MIDIIALWIGYITLFLIATYIVIFLLVLIFISIPISIRLRREKIIKNKIEAHTTEEWEKRNQK